MKYIYFIIFSQDSFFLSMNHILQVLFFTCYFDFISYSSELISHNFYFFPLEFFSHKCIFQVCISQIKSHKFLLLLQEKSKEKKKVMLFNCHFFISQFWLFFKFTNWTFFSELQEKCQNYETKCQFLSHIVNKLPSDATCWNKDANSHCIMSSVHILFLAHIAHEQIQTFKDKQLNLVQKDPSIIPLQNKKKKKKL